MAYSHNAEFTGDLAAFGADQIHAVMRLDGQTARTWRKRGFITGGEKAGRTYLYDVRDLATLLILREMNDVGIKMSTAAVAARIAADDLVAHALLQAPLIDLWVSKGDDIDSILNTIRTHPAPLASLLEAPETDFRSPFRYVITGGDDFDDWQLINDLAEIEEMEDFNLARIHLDLSKLADRLIALLEGFAKDVEGMSGDGGRVRPSTVASFHTKGAAQSILNKDEEGVRIVLFTTDPDDDYIESAEASSVISFPLNPALKPEPAA